MQDIILNVCPNIKKIKKKDGFAIVFFFIAASNHSSIKQNFLKYLLFSKQCICILISKRELAN